MAASAGPTHDVLDVLVQEHLDVEDLLNRLRLADVAERRDLADRLIAHLVRHSVVEEMFVYPTAVNYLVDGDEVVAHDLAEHEQVEGMLRELEGLDAGDQRFLGIVLDLQTSLAQHFADEEAQHFAQLRFAVPGDELVRLREGLERSERLAATGARPDSPPGEVLRGWVGRGVGMVDRVRDALSGRPTT
jgi:hypothetical protein